MGKISYTENHKLVLKAFTEKPIAHKGLHSIENGIPENSIPAFEKAIANGYPIELDVQLLADDTIVVFHDSSLIEMCGIDMKVSTIPSEKIKTIHLKDTMHKIPLLSEVLELVDDKVPVLIELKNYNIPGKLEKILLKQLRMYKGYYAVQSFNSFSMYWFVKNAPEILRGQISSHFNNVKKNSIRIFLVRNMLLNQFSKPHFIAYDSNNIPNPKLEKLQKQGLPIFVWTVRSNEEYTRVKPFCSNIIFENFIPNINNTNSF
jgi:glycerophosphoryl diester phosphodiesterase